MIAWNDAADYRLRQVGMIMQDYELMLGVPAIDNAALKLLSDPISRGSRAGIDALGGARTMGEAIALLRRLTGLNQPKRNSATPAEFTAA